MINDTHSAHELGKGWNYDSYTFVMFRVGYSLMHEAHLHFQSIIWISLQKIF